MMLAPGTHLGPYEILSPLGAGGMGEVYKARDTRLDRTVAIKVLPAHLADDVHLKERFEREARAVSSLNHPHICTLHDIGSENGIDFMVMEHIEGETLADRLLKGALPLDQALRHAIEIADALDRAHRRGVVHRDLKPGNIMLTKAGAKLLDFGLAKLAEPKGEAVGSALPTQQRPLTEEGSILGTFQYMAPEQLEGKEADGRTDIFAFGAVLYEMLTGRKAFEGKSRASLIAAIMEHEPQALSELAPMTPPALERLVKRCLAKDPDDRWQSARDLALELKWISEAGATDSVATPKEAGRSRWRERSMGVAAGAAAVGILLWAFLASAPPAERPVSHLVMPVAPADELGTGEPLTQTAMAFSPDGSELVFVGSRAGVRQLYVRSMAQFEARPLSGTEGALNPFYSPDGEWVGFWDGEAIRKIPAAGGSPVTVSTLSVPPWGITWTEDDSIVYGGRFTDGLQRVPSSGGSPEAFTTLDAGRAERTHCLPATLPGRRAVLFTSARRLDDGLEGWNILVAPLDTGEPKVLLESGADARYVPTGHLVYADSGTLMAVPFDLERLEVTGDPVALIDGVEQAASVGGFASLRSGAVQFSVAPSGTLAYVPGGILPVAPRRLVWVDPTGNVERLDAEPRQYWSPRLSPDGRRIALYDRTNVYAEALIYDIRRGALTRLTPGEGSQFPVWTPDGDRIVYSRNNDLYIVPADGSGAPEALLEAERPLAAGDWTPDGETLLYVESSTIMIAGDPLSADIWALSMSGSRESRPLLQEPAHQFEPSLSPDGKWLAYVSASDEYVGTGFVGGGNWIDAEVYVQPYPGPGPRVQVSTNGGQEPVWARDGRELYYRSPDPQQMRAVTIDTSSGFTASRPRALFDDTFLRGGRRNYDVATDGRFLMIERETLEWVAADEIHIVQNWTQELEQRVTPSR